MLHVATLPVMIKDVKGTKSLPIKKCIRKEQVKMKKEKF